MLAEAIEHREDSWSQKRLLLDVGATDEHDKVIGRSVSLFSPRSHLSLQLYGFVMFCVCFLHNDLGSKSFSDIE